ncbi:hypothetical protein GC175_17455 [bacterium]|nr:hypothetical protein [bacterium]
MLEDEYASYLVRLWRSTDSAAPLETMWHYEIEHIQSGEHQSLVDQGELVSCLRQPTVIEQSNINIDRHPNTSIPEENSMSVEQNKSIVRRLWQEVWNEQKIAVCDEIFNEAYATHEKGWATYVFTTAIPDIHFAVTDMIAEGDKVVSRLVVSGTHTGEFVGVAGTGKRFSLTATWIHRLEDGRIVEGRDWGEWNVLEFMRQVGAFPVA